MKLNQLEVPVFNLSRFTFLSSQGELVAEASDLNGFRLGRLWNDACDVGFEIESHLTGTRKRFSLVRQLTRENEVIGWELAPIELAPGRIKKVVIFND